MNWGLWVDFFEGFGQLLLAQSKNVFDQRLYLSMLFKLILALGQKQLRNFEIEVRQSVTEHGFLLALFCFDFDKKVDVEPIGDLDSALLPLLKINRKP